MREKKAVRQHKPVVKKEPKLPTRASARIRGEAPKRESGLVEEVREFKKPKTIDSLGAEDQEKFLGLLQKTLIPNTEPKVSIKQEQDEQGRTPDQILRNQFSELQIRHEWATVKVTPHRINSCV